jgi:hypothetical protein
VEDQPCGCAASGRLGTARGGSGQSGEARAIGIDAYLYFCPLVTMDLTRRQLTNANSSNVDQAAVISVLNHGDEVAP